jgi:hypothetical protein
MKRKVSKDKTAFTRIGSVSASVTQFVAAVATVVAFRTAAFDFHPTVFEIKTFKKSH